MVSIGQIRAFSATPSPATRSSLTGKRAIFIERWKRFYVAGACSHNLLAERTSNRIHPASIDLIKACRCSSDSTADGALFSALHSRRQTAAGLVQGAVGLLLIVGTLGMAVKIVWQKASQVASLSPTYEAILEFPFASGITVGTVVRIRGVDVGSVINVRPCLERIDANIQVMDSMSYIPRNALVEVNQSGLVGETIIDITPMNPVPKPSVGPLDSACSSEGLIVCDKERMKGQQGVSIDDLIRLCGKMSKTTKESDVTEFYKTAEHLENVLSSKQVLQKMEKFTEDAEPIVKGLQDGRLLNDLNEQLKQASQTARALRTSSFIEEQKRSLPKAVADLSTALNDLERTSEEVTNVLKSEKNRRNMKHLVELLSRLVDG